MINEKVKKMVVVGMVSGAMISCASRVYAATDSFTINALGDGYKYTCEKRSKKYSYVKAKCVYVHPCGHYKKDNFEKIRVKIFKQENGKKVGISKPTNNEYNTYILEEGQPYKKIYLKDNCMNVNYAYFGWCGNSDKYNAEVQVKYDGM